MMKTYLQITEGCTPISEEIDDICARLSKTSTREEVDMINSMLSNFTTLTIERDNKLHEVKKI